MTKAKSRSKAKPVEETVEPTETIQEVAVEVEAPVEVKADVVKEEKKEVKVEAPAKPSVLIEITRDEEGRAVFQVKGLSRRIAGSDTVIPEVARQIGEEILKEKLI